MPRTFKTWGEYYALVSDEVKSEISAFVNGSPMVNSPALPENITQDLSLKTKGDLPEDNGLKSTISPSDVRTKSTILTNSISRNNEQVIKKLSHKKYAFTPHMEQKDGWTRNQN